MTMMLTMTMVTGERVAGVEVGGGTGGIAIAGALEAGAGAGGGKGGAAVRGAKEPGHDSEGFFLEI